MSMFYTKLGAKLRRMREASGRSQEAMGDRMGVSFQMVQKYESGRCRIPLDRFLIWCTVCERKPVVVIHEVETGQW